MPRGTSLLPHVRSGLAMIDRIGNRPPSFQPRSNSEGQPDEHILRNVVYHHRSEGMNWLQMDFVLQIKWLEPR
jgi:hypothetical protein